MRRLGDWVLRHRGLVFLLWALVAVAGGVNTGRTVDRLSYEFALPGQPAYETNQLIQDRFGGGGSDDPLLPVARGDDAARRLVTSAALILFLAFIALSTVPSVDVKILATTLALGILIDAVVVRSLLAPALVGVLGRLTWVLPSGLARVLRARSR